jgi:polyphosphate kinase
MTNGDDEVPTDAASSTTRSGKKSGDAKGKKAKKAGKKNKIPNDVYEAELFRLQTELVSLQTWVRATGARIIVIFEGRDAAGKGGTIKRLTEYLSPRTARITALPTPTEREKTEWYYQRYVAHLPAAGEIVVFDRSWYNRAGVERVMGYCTPKQYTEFMRQTPIFEQMLVEDGILLRKYWFSVSDQEQLRRFRSRLSDPLRQWKLSTTDLESIARWEDYSRAKDEMLVHTDVPAAPWYVVESDIKKHARLNMISHFLSTIPYQDVPQPKIELPDRPAPSSGYVRPPRELSTYVPDHVAQLMGDREKHF